MDEAKDRELFLRNINWLVFVLLIAILAVINFVLLLLPIEDDAKGVILVVGALINIIFWIDSFYWLKKLPDRRYLTHYHGRLAFVGNIPILAPLRLFQLWLFFRQLRSMQVRALRDIRIKQNSNGVLLFFLFVAIVVFQTASVTILEFESANPDSNILTSGDALWWSFVTVATVGYGDKYPVTMGGRIVALLLMVVGIAMFGIFTSSLSDWFRRPRRLREQQQAKEEADRAVSEAEMRQLLEEQRQSFQKSLDELAEKLSNYDE